MKGNDMLRTSSINSLNVKSKRSDARLSSNYSDMNLARYYQSQYSFFNDGYAKKKQSISKGDGNENAGNFVYMTDPLNPNHLLFQSYGHKLEPSTKWIELPFYQSRTPFIDQTQKLTDEKFTDKKKSRCFLCSCSKRCQSDSSILSLSEPDIVQSAKCDTIDDGNTHNRLQINTNEEQYAHLTRVITPPNAFLNQTYSDTAPMFSAEATYSQSSKHQKTPSPVSYSNKVTQTDSKYVPVKEKRTALRRHFSLIQSPSQQAFMADANRHSIDSEHIYQIICEQQQFYTANNKKGLNYIRPINLEQIKILKSLEKQSYDNSSFQVKLNKVNDSQTRMPSSCNATNRSKPSLNISNFEFDYDSEPEHRIATSKNGLPCLCNKCREARGLNLTTELLPLDAQMPFHSVDNFDSFLQDGSMTELICSIL